MSDPATPVGDVVVTGQRRRSDGSMPRETFVTVPAPEGMFDEKPTIISMEEQQCSIGLNRKIWEADARAAAAVQDLMTFAASLPSGDTIFQREFGANLRYDGTTTRLSNIREGTVSGVNIDNNEVTDANWMGDIHTHPSGDGRPSVAKPTSDWPGFIDRMNRVTALGRADASYIAMYVVVQDTTAARGYRIYAYTKDSNPNQLGREVDPDAQPCS